MENAHLGYGIHLIDLQDLGMAGRTGSYVIVDDKITIIETSASPSIPYLLEGLKKLKVELAMIDYIIVTHIHLDHAGGVGLFLENCPNATVVVHPKGFRHLNSPEKLIAGAKMVYGEDFNRLFDPILPVPEHRLIVKHDQETLQIGKDRALVFYDTPGHAKHHFSLYDPLSEGIFSGDTSGIYYHMLKDRDLDYFLPTTSPNQFDPDAMLSSIQLFEDLQAKRIYFGHFGMSDQPSEVYNQMRDWVPKFVSAGAKAYEDIAIKDAEPLSAEIYKNLLDIVTVDLMSKNVPKDHSVHVILKLDLKICAMGIADFFIKTKK